MEQLIQILTPIVTAIAGWLAGRRKQNNDFLGELQSSINMLSEENRKLMTEVIQLRKENVKLQYNQQILIEQNQGLKEEMEEFRKVLQEHNIPIPRTRKKKKNEEDTTTN